MFLLFSCLSFIKTMCLTGERDTWHGERKNGKTKREIDMGGT